MISTRVTPQASVSTRRGGTRALRPYTYTAHQSSRRGRPHLARFGHAHRLYSLRFCQFIYNTSVAVAPVRQPPQSLCAQ
eukprot:scaffold42332_cov63-Phaeocystis_antarctica.AAC.4